MDQPHANTREGAESRCVGLPAWIHGFAWCALLLVTLVLVGISWRSQGRKVWEGWRESRELRRPAYTERIYLNEVFRTRANTWSNLAYVLVGFYGIAIGWHDLRQACPHGAGYLVQTPALSLTFGLACGYLGAGSGLFHASLTRFGQQLDVAAMYAPLLALIALNIGRWVPQVNLGHPRGNLPMWPVLIASAMVASSLLFIDKWSMSSIKVLGTLIAAIGLFALLDRFRTSRTLDARWLAWSCAALIAAVICRQLDLAGRFSGPDAWLQGHALWHVLTSLSLGGLYFYYRSEVTTASDHPVTEKQPGPFDHKPAPHA